MDNDSNAVHEAFAVWLDSVSEDAADDDGFGLAEAAFEAGYWKGFQAGLDVDEY